MDTTVRRPALHTVLAGLANLLGLVLVIGAAAGAHWESETYLSPDAALRYALVGVIGVVLLAVSWRILRRRIVVIDVLVIAVSLFFIYPNLRSASGRSPVRGTMADMRSIATAVEAFSTDYNRYPPAGTMDELAGQLSPTYIRVLPRHDRWQNDFRYESDSGHYAIGSAGKDRKFDKTSLRQYSRQATLNLKSDIVYRDGSFVVYPGVLVDQPVGLADFGQTTGTQTTATVAETSDSLFDKATALYQKDEWTSAIPLFRQFLKKQPDHALANARLGVCYCYIGRYDDCIRILQHATKLDPGDWHSHGNIALAYEKLGTPELGIPSAREAVKLNPREPNLNNALGLVLLRSGRAAEAIAPLEATIAIEPSRVQAHYNLVLAYKGAGMPERARAHLVRLERLDAASAKELQPELAKPK